MGTSTTKRNVLIAAAVLGLITSLLIYNFLSSNRAKQNEVMVDVVTAIRDITPRTVITAPMIEIRKMPRSQVPGGAFTQIAQVTNKVALAQLNQGMPIVQGNVDTKGIMLGLSYTIPPFMRALTVGVTPITGVAGFPKPGDHVDVVATFNRQNNTVAKTVLQNVELLALGSSLQNERVKKNGRTPELSGNDTATLLVTPSQAEQLALAEDEGKLRLVLRSAGDQSMVMSSGVKMRKEGAQSAPAQPAARAQVTNWEPQPRPWRGSEPVVVPRVEPQPAKHSTNDTQSKIEVIRGTDVEQVDVEQKN
ncbi:MAG: Flp pilus assembly protein CpaB [Armatimonadota bacterium]|nr:Flp pilus assembly protein CpaB [bacterium]